MLNSCLCLGALGKKNDVLKKTQNNYCTKQSNLYCPKLLIYFSDYFVWAELVICFAKCLHTKVSGWKNCKMNTLK